MIVKGWYFLRAIFPNMLYMAYPSPDPTPTAIPTASMLPIPPTTPAVRAHPRKAAPRAKAFFRVTFSLNTAADISITKQGAV